MKRLILTLFAAGALLGPLPAVGVAVAKDKPGGHAQRADPGDRGGGRGGSAWTRGGEAPRGGWREDNPGRGPDRREEWRAPPRSAYGPPPGYDGYAAPRAYGLRRGGYMPPQAHGAVVDDYGRYRLRPPPRGFDWMRVGDDFLLVSPDGQIFDMITR